MDADSMTRKESYRETLRSFRAGKIDIGKVFSRLFEHDGGVFGQLDRSSEQKPVRPMRPVESGNEQVGKFPRVTGRLL